MLSDDALAVNRGLNVRTAALSILLYDYSLTFADEIEYFWAKPWTFATYLFLWSRYCGLVVMICGFSVALTASGSAEMCVPMTCAVILLFILLRSFNCDFSPLKCRCLKWMTLEACLGTLNTLAVQLILQLRLYALYGSSRRIAWFCSAIFCAEAVLVVGIIIRICYNFAVFKPVTCILFHGLSFCTIENLKTYSCFYWILIASFEAFVLVLTLRRGYQYYYQRASPTLIRISPTLLRDTIAYTLLIGLVYLSNIILTSYSESNDDIGAVVGFALPGLMNGRMMLNLRRVFEKQQRSPSTPSQFSALQFASVQV